MTNESISARIDESVYLQIKTLSDSTGLTQSEVTRQLIENGLRAQKYHDEFSIDP